MFVKIERDHSRFKQIVRGKVRENLRKYVTHGEMIGRKGRDLVSIPVASARRPALPLRQERLGRRRPGRGRSKASRSASGEQESGTGQAGGEPGAHVLEVEVTLDELAAILGDELAPAAHRAQGQDRTSPSPRPATPASAKPGPNRCGTSSGPTCRPCAGRFPRTSTCRTIRGSSDPRGQALPLLEPTSAIRRPTRSIIYMMDVSGSMTDEQKEIVRTAAFWIDTWLKSQYDGVETRYIIHDAAAKEVDEQTFYHTRESGGTRISSAYKVCAEPDRQPVPAPANGTSTASSFPTATTGARTMRSSLQLLRETLLPDVNLFLLRAGRKPVWQRRVPAVAAATAFGETAENLVLAEIREQGQRSTTRSSNSWARENDRPGTIRPGQHDRPQMNHSQNPAIESSPRSWLPHLTKRFPANWSTCRSQIEGYAKRQGLDFFPTIFECVEADELNAIAAYGGFPTRYPHWRFGMEYEQLSKGYRLRAAKDLRAGDQQQSVLRLPDEVQLAGRSKAGDVPRLRALRLLQEQRLLQPDQPQDDGRDGQPRQPHPPTTWIDRAWRRSRSSSTPA